MNPSISFPVSDGFVLIDEADLPLVAPYKWRFNGSGRYRYAARWTSRAGGAKRSILLMHRVITGAPAGFSVDHVNGSTLDNRRVNLRLCSHAQNIQNRAPNRGARSRFKGVHWDSSDIRAKRWRVEVKANGRRVHVGYFADEIEAALAHDEAVKVLHGAFARLNFPDF